MLCHDMDANWVPIVHGESFSTDDPFVILWQEVYELGPEPILVRHFWLHESSHAVFKTEAALSNAVTQRTLYGFLALQRAASSAGIEAEGVWRVQSYVNDTLTVDARFYVQRATTHPRTGQIFSREV